MKTNVWTVRAILPALTLVSAVYVGCIRSSPESRNSVDSTTIQASKVIPGGGNSASESDATDARSGEDDSTHGHKAGQHGGIMVSLGRDSYHVEAVVDSQGLIRLYTLGKDETRVVDVESQSLKGFVKAEGDNQAQSISFEPEPQDGDGDRKTSLFVGKLPRELVGQRLEVTIPNIQIAGERFRLGFKTGQESHGEVLAMPNKLVDTEAKALYLTPGGRYTAADIAANGTVTAMQKFKGIKSAHDMAPSSGDKICPITETKANPNFSWVIDGKMYLFCCPPCVDEFLKLAKESTEPLPDPETFIKK